MPLADRGGGGAPDLAGPGLYWSQRVGRGNALFSMPKFRTMRIDTPEVATHLLEDPDRWLTPAGPLPAQDQPRRAAAAVERAGRRHEPGRPAPGAVQPG
jgi:hypothetical protein